MNNKELLMMAAKAAGISKDMLEKQAEALAFAGKEDDCWNPLTNDDDALRLAVKLNIDIRPNGFDTMCTTKCFQSCAETHGNDPYAATRRAIVRAAAEIGSKL